MIRQAVILAGGLGTRLRPLTDRLPKPMIPINGKPFLEYLIGTLRENGIAEVVLLLGYLPEQIMGHFGDGSKFGVRIRYSVGQLEWNTGTRIREAQDLLDERFLLLYGDNYWPLDLPRLEEFYDRHHAMASVCIYSNKDQYTKDNMKVDEQGYVVAYGRSGQSLSGVDIGFFIVDKACFSLMPHTDFSFQKTVLPRLMEQRQLAGFVSYHKYYTLSDPKRLPGTVRALSARKVIFLDRDGVINECPPKADYVKKWEEFRFLPGAFEALMLLSCNGYEIYIISNQPGIARGVMSEADLEDIDRRMKAALEEHGIRLAGAYYCKHNWNEGCGCRKPQPGMLFRAASEHCIVLPHAVFIGDDERDAQAGAGADVSTILLDENTTLLDAVRRLLGIEERAGKPALALHETEAR